MCCRPDAPERGALAAAGVSLYPLEIRNRFDPAAVRGIRTQIRSAGYDLVYAPRNDALSVSLMASRGLSVPCVGYRGTIGHLSWWDPASRLTYLNPRVARIVCVSDAVRRYLLSLGLPPSRLVTVYKGHDVSWYEGVGAVSPATFGIPEHAFVVGFTGNMRPVKGVDVLIRSAACLPSDSPVHYLLVGSVRDRRLKRMARSPRVHGRVHFAGFRPDAAALVRACRAFAMPSVAREGLPRAVIEAMAMGVPVVVTDVGGLPELVTDGVNGLIVRPRDPAGLARAFTTLAADPGICRRLGQAGRDRIRTAFHIEETIRRTLALYRDVRENPSPGAGA